ncbi:ribosomal protein S18-alanine N-acetyltransferase [Aurantiacibacter luteus]|uniref:[Ribosomal protein bS18]-alanine N-acetyltransferase n=1 Tax=Aurantiacibacter luteus TaxID=1581420 RepID=A0A0G9MWT7_9SPHN|nr:ribosomal protein S18-alanine N-acetyltransferase [Aurantiacibacter luteus]KLE35074.1 acetyltransferase [Aurantiacibacter luteus]
MSDDIDTIMAVMDDAFDPVYAEAWTRAQVLDALVFAHTHYILAEDGAGFVLSRTAADEEELLLIGVRPAARGRGVGAALMQRFIEKAQARGVKRVFLEMRAGNPAERLYRKFDFEQIGLRRNYYRRAQEGPIDAITFARSID